jgi:carbon storage regulator
VGGRARPSEGTLWVGRGDVVTTVCPVAHRMSSWAWRIVPPVGSRIVSPRITWLPTATVGRSFTCVAGPTPAEKLAFHTNGWRAFAGTLRPPRCVGDAYNMRAKGAVEIGVGANPSGYTHLEGLGQGMLVLSRKRDEKIVIGDEVVITVVEIRGDKVRLGIEAPNHVPVHRAEVHAAIANERKSRAGEV